jgi:hypothetical protein
MIPSARKFVVERFSAVLGIAQRSQPALKRSTTNLRWFLPLLMFLVVVDSSLAQCPMCKKALTDSQEGQQLVGNMNTAILFLLAFPFGILGTISFLIWRVAHRTRRQPVGFRATNPDKLPESANSSPRAIVVG